MVSRICSPCSGKIVGKLNPKECREFKRKVKDAAGDIKSDIITDR